jgi:hypothetical protein
VMRRNTNPVDEPTARARAHTHNAHTTETQRGKEYISFIGSLKAGFVTERSELGSCRAFRFQYPILLERGNEYALTDATGLLIWHEFEETVNSRDIVQLTREPIYLSIYISAIYLSIYILAV